MIRLTRKVFTDLSIWMIGLGLIIGIIFPFFVSWMGIPSDLVLTPWFLQPVSRQVLLLVV